MAWSQGRSLESLRQGVGCGYGSRTSEALRGRRCFRATASCVAARHWGASRAGRRRHLAPVRSRHARCPTCVLGRRLGGAPGGVAEWASYELRYQADKLQTEDDIADIGAAAERFGATLDDRDIEVARKEVEERLAQQDAYEDMKLQRWKDEERPAERAEEGQLDSLFQRGGDFRGSMGAGKSRRRSNDGRVRFHSEHDCTFGDAG